jgi:dTDP-4-dehydrorhamnose 3,5-epimerase
MIFESTPIPGAFLISVKRLQDDRGYFGRTWCRKEFLDHNLNPDIVQANVGFSRRKGVLRGMHYQVAPAAEAKLIRCIRGAVYDVLVDLRPDSPTRAEWWATELTHDNERMLYIPEGCAHGYQSLMEESEILYLTTGFYAPECVRGVRYDDPAFGIRWPLPVSMISEADRTWPDWR